MMTVDLKADTPIAQGIEHRPPEAGAAVRIRLGVFFVSMIILYDTEDSLW